MEHEKHKYEYSVVLDGDTAPARVIRIVGENKRVLEIGAGPGSITRHLTAVSNCRVTALDIDAESVKKVAPFCEQAYQADLNKPDWTAVLGSESKFDALVAADVLEHVYEPLTVLTTMKGLLNDKGYLVISLPHIGHAVIHACLFDENFEYGEVGLLDRTHIRFFGIKNIQKLFEDAGLKIVHAEFVIRNPENTEFARRWAKTPQELREALLKNPFSLVYQVIVKAVPIAVEGTAITLMTLSVSPQILTFKESLRSFLRTHLREETYEHLQSLNKFRYKHFARKKT